MAVFQCVSRMGVTHYVDSKKVDAVDEDKIAHQKIAANTIDLGK